jgi:hypothetical protein
LVTTSCAGWPRRRGPRSPARSTPRALAHEARLRRSAAILPWQGGVHFSPAAGRCAHSWSRCTPPRCRLKHGGVWPAPRSSPPTPAGDPVPDDRRHDAASIGLLIDPSAAELVKLRYFAGFSIVQAAEILGISPRSADRLWTYARAWLRREIEPE